MFNKQKDENKRFKTIYEHKGDTLAQHFSVIIDTETGVNYLFTAAGYAGGLTVLLDKEGKPVISEV